MKLFNKFLLLAFSIALFTTSCSSDDDAVITTSEPLGAYENGYFILNEGTSATTSGIDFVSYLGVKTEDVFRIENPNQPEIGTFLQNIFFDATRAFIVSGSTNTVTVVNRFTFEFITTVDLNVDNPRYGTVVNGKAYVTSRGADFTATTDDSISVIDLTNYNVSSFNLNSTAERIENVGNKVIVSNGDAFASTTTVSFIDVTNNNVITTLDLGTNNVPNTIEIVNNNIYVITNSNKFIEIDSSAETVTSVLDLPSSLSSPKNLQIENNVVYFTSSNSVYSFTLGDATVSTTPLLSYTTTSAYGSMYGFSVRGINIYIGDATDFASSGKVFQYNIGGDLVNEYTTSGIGPNGFYFN